MKSVKYAIACLKKDCNQFKARHEYLRDYGRNVEESFPNENNKARATHAVPR
jgi:hypothetical protein